MVYTYIVSEAASRDNTFFENYIGVDALSKKGDLRKLLKKLEAQGFTIDDKKGGYLIKSPTGVGSVTVHKTESDENAMRITLGRLRRIGFKN